MYDVEQTLLSQYATAPSLTTIIENANVAIDPASDLVQFYNTVWNLETATGFGLDNWGLILGVSRYLNISTPGAYFGFKESGDDWAPFNQAPFYSGGAFSTVFALTDTAYRQLLLAKALANISDCSIATLNKIAQSVFGVGAMFVLDLGNMQMAYVFAGIPSAVDLAIAENGNVLPHPTGVGVTIESAVLAAQLVAAAQPASFNVGYGTAVVYGTLTPGVDNNGNTIEALFYNTSSGVLELNINSGSDLGGAYFTSLNINGQVLASSAATRNYVSTFTQWVWSASPITLTAGDVYWVTLT